MKGVSSVIFFSFVEAGVDVCVEKNTLKDVNGTTGKST